MMRIHSLVIPALLSLFLLQPLYAAETRETKRVLVLYSEGMAHPAHQMTDHGIRSVFGSNKLFDVQLYTEYLDVSRFGSSSHARAMADYLRRKYSGMEIHTIITVYPYAAEFLLAERRTLFPEVPIIAAEITRTYAEKLERSPARRFVSGTICEDNVAEILDEALRMKPQTKRIALVVGTAPNDAPSEHSFNRGFRPYAGRIELIDVTKLSMEETLSRVASLPPDTLVFYLSMLRDGAGKSFVPREALSLIAQAANAPVFGLYGSYLGFGIVGGRLASFEEQGKEAGSLALRVMGSESPASLPFGGEKSYVTAYDWRELNRWHISEAMLPPGSDLRYRIPSFWDMHRVVILGVISLVIIETGLILELLLNIRRRRRAEEALRHRENELTMLTGRLISNQEEEFKRLSRELHDDLTQKLAVLAINAGMLEKTLRPLHSQIAQEVEDLKTKLIEVSDEVHNLSRQLHPSILDDLGLVQAIQSECDIFSRRTGIAVSFEPDTISVSIPPDKALCIYRVMQGALQNITKHAKASAAQIVLRDLSDGIHFIIQDFGIGFDVKQSAGRGGIGISSMRERVRLVNGTISVESEPGKGSRIQVSIPVGGTHHVQAEYPDR